MYRVSHKSQDFWKRIINTLYTIQICVFHRNAWKHVDFFIILQNYIFGPAGGAIVQYQKYLHMCYVHWRVTCTIIGTSAKDVKGTTV